THGRLAEELVAVLEHVVGPQRAIATVCIGPDDDLEKRRKEIVDGIKRVNEGQGTVVLTDMFGGTPSNLAISGMDQAKVEGIAGGTLPMLVKLASVRNTMTLPQAVEAAQVSGRKYINVASKLLADQKK